MSKTAASKEELLTQQILGEDYFYEYGMDPSVKHLVKIYQQNTYEGQSFPNVTKITYPSRILFSRNFSDFLQRDIKATTAVQAGMLSYSSYIILRYSWKVFRQFLPIGSFGIRHYSQTHLFKAWGLAGVAASLLIPLSGAFVFWNTQAYFIRMFYERVILQNKDFIGEWASTRSPENSTYFYNDVPLNRNIISPQERKVLDQKSIPMPSYFKE